MHTHTYHKPLHILVPVVCSIKLDRNKKKKLNKNITHYSYADT